MLQSILALLLLISFQVSAEVIAKMPIKVSNNAVAKVTTNNTSYFLSFNGLGENKSYQDVHNQAFAFNWHTKQWRTIAPVPIAKPIKGLSGRLASTAVGIKGIAYIFGGYTVAKDHSEVSVPDVYAYNISTNQYHTRAPMPVPVDDSVALSYQQRYIYLISGWHNDGNVNLVQVYDTQTNSWQQASPFPGKPVFGQAGAIIGDKILVCDGVKVDYHADKRRSFSAEPACYLGIVDDNNVSKIDWRTIGHPTGTARYRMASIGLPKENKMIFIGGSDNPYNYNGVGYNGEPSEPSDQAWIFDLKNNHWQVKKLNLATMDHRGLLEHNQQLFTLGGMGPNQKVLATLNLYPNVLK